MAGYGSARYDLPRCAETTKVFVIASAYRAGSTMLATTLWEKGAFGAPWDDFNFENKEMDIMMACLGAASLDEYVAKLFELRVSSNGVFSTKTHFHHFNSALQQLGGAAPAIGRRAIPLCESAGQDRRGDIDGEGAADQWMDVVRQGAEGAIVLQPRVHR